MTKFAIPVTISGYSVDQGNSVVATKLDGGRPRSRRDILNPSTHVSVSWVMNVEQYNYAQAFYRSVTVEGALPFTIDLAINTAAKATYTANFVPGSFKLTGKSGDVHFVSAELDVTAIAGNSAADIALVAAYNTAHGVA